MEKKKIYLDKNGYQQYLKEIDDLRNELDNLEKDNVTTYLNNLEGDTTLSTRKVLMNNLRDKLNNLGNIEIVEKKADNDIIDIGDVIRLNLIFSKHDMEEITVKLIGGTKCVVNDPIKDVTLNSPLGAALYHKRVTDDIYYMLRDNKVRVEVLEKLNIHTLQTETEEKETVKTLKK